MVREFIEMLKRRWRRVWGWQPLYWLRCHTFTRYHIVDCRTPDYRWGWMDRDGLMYNACFNILVDFVEKEDPEVGFATMDDYAYEGMDDSARAMIEKQIADDREIRALYEWWKHGRAEERKACSKLLEGVDTSFDKMFKKIDSDGEFSGYEYTRPTNPQWDAWNDEYTRLEEKDEEMFQRLIAVRGRLWT